MNFEEQIKKLVQHPEKIRVVRLEKNIFQEVADELAYERVRLGYDKHYQRAMEDWSILNSQVVGAEYSLA
jgi:hypothetical protein